MMGERTRDVAAKHGLSAARISQKRREFCHDWLAFCGELPAVPVALSGIGVACMPDQDPVLSMPLDGDPDAAPVPSEVPLGRPSWSGPLHIGLLTIPIKAYPALVCAPPLPAHLLHAGCGQRLYYDKCCPRHGKLDATAIVKDYEYAPGQFLVLEETEMQRVRPARDRALTLGNFIGLEQIDPLLYAGRSLYLAPAGLAAAAAYTVLTQALRTRRQAALARLVLSGRRHLALLRPRRTLLLLHLLHYPAQLRSGARLEAELPIQQIGATELRLAGELIDAYRRPLSWSDYVDDSVQALLSVVRAKLHGQTPTEPDLQPTPLPDLLNTLRQSVAALAVNPSTGIVRSRKQASVPRRSS